MADVFTAKCLTVQQVSLGGRIGTNWRYSWRLKGFIKALLSLRNRCKVREMRNKERQPGLNISTLSHSFLLSFSVLVWPKAMPVTSYIKMKFPRLPFYTVFLNSLYLLPCFLLWLFSYLAGNMQWAWLSTSRVLGSNLNSTLVLISSLTNIFP